MDDMIEVKKVLREMKEKYPHLKETITLIETKLSLVRFVKDGLKKKYIAAIKNILIQKEQNDYDIRLLESLGFDSSKIESILGILTDDDKKRCLDAMK